VKFFYSAWSGIKKMADFLVLEAQFIRLKIRDPVHFQYLYRMVGGGGGGEEK
jgi:hypothetical protein